MATPAPGETKTVREVSSQMLADNERRRGNAGVSPVVGDSSPSNNCEPFSVMPAGVGAVEAVEGADEADDAGDECKRRRISLTLAEKVRIIEQKQAQKMTLEGLQEWCATALGKRPAPSSLSIILKNAESLQRAAQNATSSAELEKKKRRRGNVPELEEQLWAWWQHAQGVGIQGRGGNSPASMPDDAVILQAREIGKRLSLPSTFNYSKKWFYHWKSKMGLTHKRSSTPASMPITPTSPAVPGFLAQPNNSAVVSKTRFITREFFDGDEEEEAGLSTKIWSVFQQGDNMESLLTEATGSTRIATELAASLQSDTFTTFDSLCNTADAAFRRLTVPEWLNVFASHPRLGDREALSKKYGMEQSRILDGNDDKINKMMEWNRKYEEKFGHIFLLCAQGRSLDEIIDTISLRFYNHTFEELRIASEEHIKITKLRLVNLWEKHQLSQRDIATRRLGYIGSQLAEPPHELQVSGKGPITSHVLDTSTGRPANNIMVKILKRPLESSGKWIFIGSAETNEDGRIAHFLTSGGTPSPALQPPLEAAQYRVIFNTREYFEISCNSHAVFYPQVTVDFNVLPDQIHEHFHIPLLLSPYGYSTYRGS